jgi:hypothetical protein
MRTKARTRGIESGNGHATPPAASRKPANSGQANDQEISRLGRIDASSVLLLQVVKSAEAAI